MLTDDSNNVARADLRLGGGGDDADLAEDVSFDQRRVRHITAILVRNLSLSPNKDQAVRSLQSHVFPSVSSSSNQDASGATAADDTDLYYSTHRRRRRNSSLSSISTVHTFRSAQHGTQKGQSGLPEEEDEVASMGRTLSMSSTKSKRNLQGKAQADSSSIQSSGSGSRFSSSRQQHQTDWFYSSSPASSIAAGLPTPGPHVAFPASTALSLSYGTSPSTRGGSLARRRRPDPKAAQIHQQKMTSSTYRSWDEVINARLVDSFVTLSQPAPTAESDGRDQNAGGGRPPFGSKCICPSLESSARKAWSASSSLRPPSFTSSATSSPPFFVSYPKTASMNPTFANFDPTIDFADWADLNSERVIIGVWVRTRDDQDKKKAKANGNADGSMPEGKGKEKAGYREVDGVLEEDSAKDFRLLKEWELDLSRLKKINQDLARPNEPLPPNTILLALSTNGDPSSAELFAVPQSPPPSRAESPAGDGNLSDPEPGSSSSMRSRRAAALAASRRRWKEGEDVIKKSVRETKMMRSYGFGDIVRLTTVQSCIVDNQKSIQAVVDKLDRLVSSADSLARLSREKSEREGRLAQLRNDCEETSKEKQALSSTLERRRRALRRRRERLAAAKAATEQDMDELAAARANIQSLKQVPTLHLHPSTSSRASVTVSIQARRISLLQTLEFIFPVEPVDPSTLTFSINNHPLPNSAFDPKKDNDDVVASALGYVAQLVNLLAAYLSVRLHYPITVAGSRSAIKDPISQMHGPRVFPLYWKNVDRYRFDYAVFLLNKDVEQVSQLMDGLIIEGLMMSQELIVLDVRHTLPNLKNLVVTVTSSTPSVALKSRPRAREESSEIALTATSTSDGRAAAGTLIAPQPKRPLLSPGRLSPIPSTPVRAVLGGFFGGGEEEEGEHAEETDEREKEDGTGDGGRAQGMPDRSGSPRQERLLSRHIASAKVEAGVTAGEKHIVPNGAGTGTGTGKS